MAKPPPICKYCNLELKWPPWTGKPSRPVEKSGKQHECPKFKNRKSYGSSSGFTCDFNPDWDPKLLYQFCGKCKTLCEVDNKTWQWCPKCEMYPQVTFYSENKDDVPNFEANPNVKPLSDTNEFEIMEEYRIKYGEDAPSNFMHMNEDGTMSGDREITKELTNWYQKDGSEILKEMRSKIYYKKKERIL